MLSSPEFLLFFNSLMHLKKSSMVMFPVFIGSASCMIVTVGFIDTIGG